MKPRRVENAYGACRILHKSVGHKPRTSPNKIITVRFTRFVFIVRRNLNPFLNVSGHAGSTQNLGPDRMPSTVPGGPSAKNYPSPTARTQSGKGRRRRPGRPQLHTWRTPISARIMHCLHRGRQPCSCRRNRQRSGGPRQKCSTHPWPTCNFDRRSRGVQATVIMLCVVPWHTSLSSWIDLHAQAQHLVKHQCSHQQLFYNRSHTSAGASVALRVGRRGWVSVQLGMPAVNSGSRSHYL